MDILIEVDVAVLTQKSIGKKTTNSGSFCCNFEDNSFFFRKPPSFLRPSSHWMRPPKFRLKTASCSCAGHCVWGSAIIIAVFLFLLHIFVLLLTLSVQRWVICIFIKQIQIFCLVARKCLFLTKLTNVNRRMYSQSFYVETLIPAWWYLEAGPLGGK